MCPLSLSLLFFFHNVVVFMLRSLIQIANSNGDRVAWRELTVFASHVHPSVAAMAQTLLSGVNIVYNGNPISDLSLGAFLDKFMEKKPKQNTWHGASEIEPAKKVSISAFLLAL